MSTFDRSRVAMVVARSAGDGAYGAAVEEVGTGYFLTGDLVLTARHVADRPDCQLSVRAEIDGPEEDRWTDAVPQWIGVDDVDAILLRTVRRFGDWEMPALGAITEGGNWESAGYARVAADESAGNRKTLPLYGTYGMSLGQGPGEIALTTMQSIAATWENYWKGISGAPVFSKDSSEDGLIGIITDANRALSDGLVGLPAIRLANELSFRSIIAPPFLGPLPAKPCCLVLTRESAPSELVEQTADVLAGFRSEDPQFQEIDAEPIEIPVLKAVESVENWAATVDALAKADYLIADVTSFEPAVMLLLGIRSVVRRGVTISVTGGELEAHSSAIPFNVQETRVLSASDENFFDDLHRAMVEGAVNLARDSNYLDLPSYHAVRTPRPEAWANNNADKNLLILCPFGPGYTDFYEGTLRPIIRGRTGNMTPVRMLDLRSPRLIGQALYEQIRWSKRCLVDWTGWRANVFFELGVRLACSEYDPLCIIQASDGEEGSDQAELVQCGLLRGLFEPVEYDRTKPRDALVRPLRSLADSPQPGNDTSRSQRALPSAATFTVAQDSFGWERDVMLTPPHIELRVEAEQILGKDREQTPERLVLFADNYQFSAALQATVWEKWVAAWLYLRHLYTAADSSPADIGSELITVGQLAQRALSSSKEPRLRQLRKEIQEFLGLTEIGAEPEKTTAMVADDLDQVLALKASAKDSRDDEHWEAAIGDLQEAIGLLARHVAGTSPSVPSWLASELADTYGLLGGIEKRWGLQQAGAERRRHLEASVAAYDEGFRYERDLEPKEANTYNRVNRLVGRVLTNPRIVAGDAGFSEELRTAEEVITAQLGYAREKDPWAYCDLGTVRLLRGKPDALAAFRELDRLHPPSFVYDSALATLEPLREVISGLRPDLLQAIAQLQRSARSSK
jgi:hypothetical protein